MFNLNPFGDKSVSNVRRSLIFDKVIEKPSEAKADRFQNGKSSRRLSIARRQLDFGESEPSVLLRCADLLPDRDDPDEVSSYEESFRVKRTCFTFKQKTKLEELFQKKKFLNKNEKTRLAIELGITKLEIQMWFTKRRQQWKKQNKGGHESRPCVQQKNLQTPFPRPSQNAFLRVTTATVQFSADGSDSLPGDLLYGREDLNPRHGETLDNSSECCLCTPARVTYNTKHVARFLRQE